jgi:hypothetical protein
MNNKAAKPKAARLKYYADRFRNFPEYQRPSSISEDGKEGPKLPYRPTNLWLRNAGGLAHRVLRIGGFRKFEAQFLAALDRGDHVTLWEELVKILRARANVPYIFDYLETFAEDCQLVADELDKEASGGEVKQRMEKKRRKTPLPIQEKKGKPDGEWSKPMSKSKMKNALRIDGYRTFNIFARHHGILPAGNRQLWQIRLDRMDETTRKKLEKI